jgi:hypothetical protein
VTAIIDNDLPSVNTKSRTYQHLYFDTLIGGIHAIDHWIGC